MRMASRRPSRSALDQASTLRRAAFCVSFSRPRWCCSAPQQASPLGIITSTPWRLSSLIAARLMEGCNTSCTQPSSSATRLTGSPAGRTTGSVLRRSPRRQARRHERERGGAGLHAERRYQPAERTGEPAKKKCHAEAAWARQHLGKKPARGRVVPASALFARCGRARDRRDACSPPRSGRWSCRRGRTDTGRCGG